MRISLIRSANFGMGVCRSSTWLALSRCSRCSRSCRARTNPSWIRSMAAAMYLTPVW